MKKMGLALVLAVSLCLTLAIIISSYLASDIILAYEADMREDYEKSFKHIKKACDNGYMKSCLNVGALYIGGRGVEQDYFKAIEYYEKACDGGNMEGCVILGSSYVHGRGVEKNYVKAKEYYQKACDKGNEKGCDHLGSLDFYAKQERLEANRSKSWAAQADDDETYSRMIQRSEMEKFISNPDIFFKNMGMKEVMKDGKMEGFRVLSINENSSLAKLGLRAGDIVQSFNGVKLDSYASAIEVLSKANSISRVKLEIIRNSEKKEFKYEIYE